MQVRCWEVQQTGQTIPKAQQTHQGSVLDVCWSDVSFALFKLFLFIYSIFLFKKMVCFFWFFNMSTKFYLFLAHRMDPKYFLHLVILP